MYVLCIISLLQCTKDFTNFSLLYVTANGIIIEASPLVAGKTNGLCGNFDGYSYNDRTGLNGIQLDEWNDFLEEYREKQDQYSGDYNDQQDSVPPPVLQKGVCTVRFLS